MGKYTPTLPHFSHLISLQSFSVYTCKQAFIDLSCIVKLGKLQSKSNRGHSDNKSCSLVVKKICFFACGVLYLWKFYFPKCLCCQTILTSVVFLCNIVDGCVYICQLFFSVGCHRTSRDTATTHAWLHAKSSMTQPPFDRDLADLLKLRYMWFHFKALNMACIKHNTVNWMSGFTLRCLENVHVQNQYVCVCVCASSRKSDH